MRSRPVNIALLVNFVCSCVSALVINPRRTGVSFAKVGSSIHARKRHRSTMLEVAHISPEEFVENDGIAFVDSTELPGFYEAYTIESYEIEHVEHGSLIDQIVKSPSISIGRGMVLAASAIYGTNFAAVKMMDDHIPTSVSAALRFTLAAVAVSAGVLWNEKSSADPKVRHERQQSMLAGMEVGCWYCLAYLFQAYGLRTVDASQSAFFNALAVVVVPLLDVAFRGIQMTAARAVSVAMAVVGVAMIQLGPSEQTFLSRDELFCLSQALFFGIGYWRLEAASTLYPDQLARNTMGQLLAVAGGCITYMLATGNQPSFHEISGWLSDNFIVGALLWTGLVSTAFALYLETLALKVVSATELTVLMTSVSLWGSAFAYVAIGDVLSPIGLAGGLMILSGCVVSSLANNDQ